MSGFMQLRLALAAIGIVIWGLYGYRLDNAALRWVGIAFLGASLLLRFTPKRWRREDTERPSPE